MDRDSVNRLRFDRRLEQRRGWVEDSERQANLESLTDVSDKMTRGLDEPEAADDAKAPVPMSSQAHVETPAEGSFNPPGGFSAGGTELS